MNDTIDSLLAPSSWFSSKVEYVGDGYAEFSNPKGWIKGKGVATYDELGKATIHLEMKEWGNAESLAAEEEKFNYYWLACGYKPKPFMSSYMWGSDNSQNICRLLSISTSEGFYLANNRINYTWGQSNADEFAFETDRATYFAQRETTESKYWAMPLLNFVTRSFETYTGLNNHPLRIHPIRPEALEYLSSDAPENEKQFLQNQLLARRYLFAFEYQGEMGFIEELPDYTTKKDQLYNKKSVCAQTAMMVGSTINPTDELDPLDFLGVLGVAIGNEVSTPWIEYRDAEANLVSRVHGYYGIPEFHHSRSAIDHSIFKGGIGELLTSAAKTAYFREDEMRAIMRNYVGSKAHTDTSTILFYTCAALDVMCNYLDLKFDLAQSLTTIQRAEVKEILKKAAQEVKNLGTFAGTSAEQKQTLDKVANNMQSQPLTKRAAFGDQIVLLLSHFGFGDKSVADNYYVAQGRDMDYWKDLLTDYRNQTMHEAYYSAKKRRMSQDDLFDEIIVILFHLRDILLRAILRLLDYDGEYHPGVKEFMVKSVSWVTADLDPTLLDYR